jgi:predicted DNA-binding transcriptional regulator YafY
VSRRTLMRDLDFLRDDHHAPIAYDDSRKGFRLTDPTFKLAPVELTGREVFSFSIARKLLERFEGRPLELDMRSVLAKIADSLRATVSLDHEKNTPVKNQFVRGLGMLERKTLHGLGLHGFIPESKPAER